MAEINRCYKGRIMSKTVPDVRYCQADKDHEGKHFTIYLGKKVEWSE